jgi:parvulin-like peptidyl-prolyl isomerase
MRRIISEPLFQFFVLGILLYATVSFIRSRHEREAREIDVNSDRVTMMIVNYKNQMGVPPTAQQLNALIDNYIREEIAFREAKKLGLDKDDEIIRRRLSQKYEFLNADLGETATPTEDQLRRFYQDHPALFSSETTVSFSHIYFKSDNSADSVAKQRALKVLGEFRNSRIQHAPEKGDHFALQYDYTDQSVVDIRSNFGDKPIVDSLFRGVVGRWLGPVQSGYGWHLVFLSKRDSSRVLPYESVSADVKQRYMDAEKEKQNKAAFEKVSKDYIIKRNYLNDK